MKSSERRARRAACLAVALTASACAGAPERTSEQVQAEVFRDGLMFVRGTLAGHEAKMLLDTGAGATVVAKAFADRIGLDTSSGSQGTALGIAANTAAVRVERVALSIGRLETEMPVVVLPLDVAPALGRDLEVVLGRDLFRAYVVELDYATGTVTLHDPQGYRYRGGGVTLPMQQGELDAFYVEGLIEDLGRAWLELDTGSTTTLTLHAPFVERHALLAGRPRGTGLRGGVGGALDVVTTRLDHLSLGGAVFRDVPVDTDSSQAGAFRRTKADGNLGSSLLRRFRVTIDSSRMQLHLEPIAERVGTPFPRNRSGLALAFHGTYLEVLQVMAESPAAVAGIRVGDRIVAVDGVAVNASYWDSQWTWVRGSAGTTVNLELANGDRRTFRLGEVP